MSLHSIHHFISGFFQLFIYTFFFNYLFFFVLLVYQQCVSFLLLSRIPFHRFTWMHLSFHMWMYILVALSFLDVMCKAAITIQYNFLCDPYISVCWVICKMTDCFSRIIWVYQQITQITQNTQSWELENWMTEPHIQAGLEI